MSDRLDPPNVVRILRLRVTRRLAVALAIVPLMIVLAAPAHAACPTGADQVFFSAHTNVTDILVQCINNETVRLDISSWYLSEHSISIAIANRFAAGVPVRIIGDRGAIFEADPHTKAEYYWLANQGIPIRLRFNPTWFPELVHWKAAIFVGQNLVEFGSGNFAPTELAPNSAHDYSDESELFTRDPQIVAALKMKFDRMWNDTTVEPQSIISGPPYLKDWNDACANEPTGTCDFHTVYPNAAPMIVNTARLEPDVAIPPDLIFGQGPEFNNRITQEINSEQTRADIIVYRLQVDNITQALLQKHQAGVPVRIIVDRNQYTNPLYPEYWLTHANIDKLWAAGVPVLQNNHAGVTHMKTLITSNYATNGSSNFGPNWQRDHNYFVSAIGKPAIYQGFKNEFQAMWSDTIDFVPLVTTPPSQPDIATPAPGASGVPVTTSLVWNRAAWAVSYDVYLGTSPSAMSLVANVPAELVQNPPLQYSWTPPSPLQGNTTYYWKVVSRTFANMTASTSNQLFTTGAGSGGGTLPSPWLHQDIGAFGIAGSASFSGGVFTVAGAGSDIWGTADSFHFAYQSLAGDGQIVARVVGLQNTNGNAKAGLMFRSSQASNAAHVIIDLQPGGSIEFMSRASNGGSTSWLAGASDPAPAWVKLVRSGSTVTGFVSPDGSTWTTVGSTTVALGATASVGLAVTSHNTGQLNTATFDQVALTPASGGTPPGTPASPGPASGATGVVTNPTLTWSSSGATSYDVKLGTANPPTTQVSTGQSASSYSTGTLQNGQQYFWQIVARNSTGTTTGPVWSFTTAAALPSPWVNQDVGAVGIAGSTSFSSGTFTVRGAGGDIWGAADGFQFAYQTLSTDGQIVTRVASLQNTNGNAKAGVMLRGNQTAGSAHVILDVQPGGSIEFMTRSTNGGQTSWLAGTTDPAPVWLRLVRSGSTVTGSVSANGSTWTTVGSTTISLPASASVGLVVTSHDTSQLNTATFDQVAVTPASGGTPPGTPASPGPASGVTGVVTNPTLTWSSSGATSYDVKLGTANPPTTQVSTGQSASSYSTGTLQNSQQYLWQIVARNSTGTTPGPVWSFTTGASSTPANIVIYASDIPAAARHGSWTTSSDTTSPNNTKLITPDAGAPTAPNAAAAPTNYVDVTFTANAGTPYTIWLRLKALNNSKFNDSIFVQFSDAQAGGSGIYGLNTTSGLLVNLANDSSGASLQGWGWVNGAYWLSQPTTLTFASSGSHTLRIQVREDGLQFDQIVLSPTTYLSAPPGPASNDATIVPKP